MKTAIVTLCLAAFATAGIVGDSMREEGGYGHHHGDNLNMGVHGGLGGLEAGIHGGLNGFDMNIGGHGGHDGMNMGGHGGLDGMNIGGQGGFGGMNMGGQGGFGGMNMDGMHGMHGINGMSYEMMVKYFGLSPIDLYYFGNMGIYPLPTGHCTCPSPLVVRNGMQYHKGNMHEEHGGFTPYMGSRGNFGDDVKDGVKTVVEEKPAASKEEH